MSRWDKLSMGDRASLVSLFVNNGVVDPKEMRRLYDEGGDVYDIEPSVVEASYPREREVLELVNNSKADFVSRLKDSNRQTIPDWKDKGKVATHKLSYAQDGDRWIVYPLVQNIDGKLYDFEDPQYGLDKGWQALDSALYSGDYVELPSKADARWFTESYKNHYPGFNRYDKGGKKDSVDDVDAISGADPNPVDTNPQESKTAWFDWWYKYRGDQIDNIRKTKGEYLTSNKKFNKEFTDYVNDRIGSVGESYNDIYRDAVSVPKHIVAASGDSTSRKQIIDFGRLFERDRYEPSAKGLDLFTEGLYMPYYHNIIYGLDNNGNIQSDVMIHERTHTLRDNPYYPVFQNENAKYIKSGNSYLVEGEEMDKYLDSYSEIYARLNAFRYSNKLNPSHTYSKNEISRFRNDGLLKKYDLDRYTDDYLYFLLNGLADSGESINNESGVNSASFGGLINRYDGKTEKSQRMVVLGKDDYFVPKELEAAVVTAESNSKPKLNIPIDYFFPERYDVGYKLDTLRDVMQSIVNREKRKPTSVDILKSYRSAYNNPFITNPYYRNYINYGYNRFDEGGDKNKFHTGGWFAKKYTGTFNEAFRNARADGRKYFRWNGKRYNTDITPNPIVEAVRNWDTDGDLSKRDFKMQVIRNPNAILEYYNKTYPSGRYSKMNKLINQYDFDTMYKLGTKGIEGLVIPRNTKYSIGDEIWNELNNSDLTYNQKLAILANSFHETAGWTALTQYGGGPAKGVFMMEPSQRKMYINWLNKNGLNDSYGNQTKYVVELFANKDKSLSTSWDNKADKQDIIRGFKNEDEAKRMGAGFRSAYNHMDYTTDNAYDDWYSDSLDANTKAFEGLFERAGVPALENRQRIAFILGNRYK